MTDSGAVVLYAEFTARAGAAPTVDGLLRDFAQVVRAEPGNVTFDVYRRAEAPDRFFVFEIYVNRAAFDQHLAAPAGRQFNDALGPLIVQSGSQLSFLRPVEP